MNKPYTQMNYFKKIFLSLAILSSPVAFGQDCILGIDGEESTGVGIYIKDLASGEVLVDHNSQMALTPASVMKVVTSATALSLRGADERFHTPVLLKGSQGQNGTWKGNLIVRSCADPTLESEYFRGNTGFAERIINNLKAQGISRITGKIVVEQSLKDAGPIWQWEVEDLGWSYGAGLFGFNYMDNSFTLWPNTGKTKPEIPDLKLEVRKASSNDLIRGIYSDRLVVFTRDTRDTKWAVTSTMPDPSAVFIHQLKGMLQNAGIKLEGNKDACASTDPEKILFTHTSSRFGDILKSLMVRSDNLFAEGMLRAIAPGDSRKAAIKAEKGFWEENGVSPRYTIINDGSGLTRANRLAPRFLGEILEFMAKSELAETYVSFFPRAGKDGTMRGFLGKSPLRGLIALKTGSVSSVQCYAGYKLDAETNQPTHLIVIMVNGFFCPRKDVREATEKLLTDLFVD